MDLLIVVGLFPLISSLPVIPTPSSETGLFNDRDLGLEARTEADKLISALRGIAKDPGAGQVISEVFDRDNVCLNNVEEAVQAIRDGSGLVEASEPDLRTLSSMLQSLNGLKDEAEVVSEIASIFRALEPLLNKISPSQSSSQICPDSPGAYIASLSLVIAELSENDQVQPEARTTLAESTPVLSTVTNFIQTLRSQTKEFQNFCSTDQETSNKSIRAMGEIITSLADMAAELGNADVAEEIRRRKGIPDQIIVSSVILRYVWSSLIFFRHKSRPRRTWTSGWSVQLPTSPAPPPPWRTSPTSSGTSASTRLRLSLELTSTYRYLPIFRGDLSLFCFPSLLVGIKLFLNSKGTIFCDILLRCKILSSSLIKRCLEINNKVFSETMQNTRNFSIYKTR